MARKAINITPSLLETVRKYRMELYNGFIKKEDVLKTIRGEYEPKVELTLGSAFHLLLQNGTEKYLQSDGSYKVVDASMPNEIIFTAEQVETVVAYEQRVPFGVKECKVNGWINVGDYKVRLSSKVDMLVGTIIEEHKTSKYAQSTKDFEDSLQWRTYLYLLPECDKVVYNLFQLNNTKKYGLRVNYGTCNFYRYKGLKADLSEWIKLTLEFAKSTQTLNYLRPEWIKTYDE